ncbi:MAG: hypothetical protein ACI31S_05820 [Bacilli bacterium]
MQIKRFIIILISGDELEVENIFDMRNCHNKFYDEIYDSEYLLDGMDANRLPIDKKKNKEYGNFDIDEFRLVFEKVNNSAMVTREIIFEEVRKEIDI